VRTWRVWPEEADDQASWYHASFVNTSFHLTPRQQHSSGDKLATRPQQHTHDHTHNTGRITSRLAVQARASTMQALQRRCLRPHAAPAPASGSSRAQLCRQLRLPAWRGARGGGPCTRPRATRLALRAAAATVALPNTPSSDQSRFSSNSYVSSAPDAVAPVAPLPTPPKSSSDWSVLPYLWQLAVAEKQLSWRLGAAFVCMLVSKSAGEAAGGASGRGWAPGQHVHTPV
jgi:hypothetical protein